MRSFLSHSLRSEILFLPSVIQADLQFQERQVGIAVVRLVLALLRDILLENLRRLRIVSVEAVEDGVNVLGSLGTIVEGGHLCGGRWESEG